MDDYCRYLKELRNSTVFKVEYTEKNKIFGKINIQHQYKEHNISDEYYIMILLEKNFYPKFYEFEGKIPNEYHHHTEEKEIVFCEIKFQRRSLCLAANAEIVMFFKKNNSINEFINLFLIPYLYNYSHLKKYGECAWEGYSHGEQGVKEYYRDKLKINDEKKVQYYLRLVVNNNLFWECPCGSKKKFKICHYLFISEIPKSIIKTDFYRITENFTLDEVLKKKRIWSTKKKCWK